MNATYKFYLSFENSICQVNIGKLAKFAIYITLFLPQDYVTEKFFNILPYDVIPVVYNGANMSRIAPPHSYINVQDFPSIKDLSDYLKKVHRNDTLFASYFWWRDYYTSKVGQSDSVHT